MDLLYTIGIILSGLAGFLLSRYIKNTKQQKGHLVCPLGHNCESVISGRFSRFLGLRVEKMGMAYYGLITLFYIINLIHPFSQGIIVTGVLITGASFAFSLYLTLTQLLVLKKWCTLCLGSASLSFMIVVLSFLGLKASFFEFIFGYRDLLTWLYLFGVILGTGVTTLHLKKFIKFLRDFKISKKESHRLAMFSQTAWVAIGITLLAGIGLVLTDQYNEILGGSRFIVMAVVTAILVVYEVIANMYIGPHLVDIHFGDHPELDDHEHSYKRKLAFAFAATGVVSWYVLLLLSAVSWYGTSSGALFVMYVVFVLLAVSFSVIAESIFYKKSVLSLAKEQSEDNKEKQD